VKRTAAKLSCRQRSMIGATPHRYRVAASTTSSTAASASLAGISTRRERGKVAKQDATEMSASAAERGGRSMSPSESATPMTASEIEPSQSQIFFER
jgi:hypothetical protein